MPKITEQQDTDQEIKELQSAVEIRQTLTDRLALWITDTLGTLWFLAICIIFLLLYFVWNTGLLPVKAFDPYPFNDLDTSLSVFAVILSVSVLISQNRQRRIESIRAQVEFEVNVRAENEVTKILEMLHEIQIKLGIDKHDPELEKMKEMTDLDLLHKKVDEIASEH